VTLLNEIAMPDTERLVVREENTVHLPLGLFGFERIKHYVLLTRPDEQPFLQLQMLDPGEHAFVVLPLETVLPDYRPELSAQDVSFLGLSDPADAMLLGIVTLHPDGTATINLRGPIVLNRHSLVGKQVIPQNAASFELRYRLPLPA
jgi:flagellar assembly factor FliW